MVSLFYLIETQANDTNSSYVEYYFSSLIMQFPYSLKFFREVDWSISRLVRW